MYCNVYYNVMYGIVYFFDNVMYGNDNVVYDILYTCIHYVHNNVM